MVGKSSWLCCLGWYNQEKWEVDRPDRANIFCEDKVQTPEGPLLRYYPVCITSLCQKRKILPFLPPHLGKYDQQHCHKALQQARAVPLQQTQSVHSQINPLCPARSTAEPSGRAAQRGTGQAAELSKTLPYS